jgi:C-terminal processing protease CtpA/Prc
MKKFTAVFLLIAFCGCAQKKNTASWPTEQVEPDVSNVTLPAILTPMQEHNLNVLCRVWGFLKYFHSDPAKGKVNMDKALFLVLPGVLQSSNEDSLQNLLVEWVDDLGKVDANPSSENNAKAFIEPKMEWLNSGSFLKEKLRTKLQYILNHHYADENFYVKRMRFNNPDFSNEFGLRRIRGEDDGMRILCLFRFWNMVEYYFPSKLQTADNWDETLVKFIPVFAAKQTDSAYRMQTCRLVAAIHDTHAAAIGYDTATQKYNGKYLLPVMVRDVEGFMTVIYHFSDSLERKSLLKPGDRIIAINDVSVESLLDSAKPFISASNATALVTNAIQKISNSFLRNNKLKIIRDGKTMEVVATYMSRHFSPGMRRTYSSQYPMYAMLDAETGYINLDKIKFDSLESIFKSLANTKGIVIDIRNYPQQFVPYLLAKYIKPKKSPFVKFSQIDYNLPGRFVLRDPQENGENNKNYYKGKIVILVNETSISQSEFTAMAFRTAPNAIVMGSQTMGADGDVSLMRLPGNLNAVISGLGVYYPDGRATQGPGIVPDIEVKVTAKGLREGKDEVMDAAMAYIKK